MNNSGTIVVLAQSENWCSVIRRHFPHQQLSWVLDTDGLIAESKSGRTILGIVELPPGNPEKTCLALAPLVNNPFRTVLMAVGQNNLHEIATLLEVTGFHAYFTSLFQIQQLVDATAQINSRQHHNQASIEQTVQENLPWNPGKSRPACD